MIIREWRGRASAEQTEAYPDHFHQVVVPELRGRAGFLGAYLGRRLDDDEIEFVVLTRWESMEAIKAFAGEDPARAVVDARAAATLRDFDATVQHFDVIEEI
jgi:heme-degrading monooxygenase HmoA